jgi:hypothetical protein
LNIDLLIDSCVICDPHVREYHWENIVGRLFTVLIQNARYQNNHNPIREISNQGSTNLCEHPVNL